jgi:hypothetical protein
VVFTTNVVSLNPTQARCTQYNIQWHAAGRWFFPGTPVSSTNKTGRLDIAEILLKVVLNTINQTILMVWIILSGASCIGKFLGTLDSTYLSLFLDNLWKDTFEKPESLKLGKIIV